MKKYVTLKIEARGRKESPRDLIIIERSWSLINEGMRAIDLQRRRLQSGEPEDKEFLFRWWIDLQFLIVALRRFRKSVELASSVISIENSVKTAIAEFDNKLPMLLKMRNVGEHIDEYATDNKKRRHKEVRRFDLQVGSFDGVVYSWLGESLNINEAQSAAAHLWQTMRLIFQKYRGHTSI